MSGISLMAHSRRKEWGDRSNGQNELKFFLTRPPCRSRIRHVPIALQNLHRKPEVGRQNMTVRSLPRLTAYLSALASAFHGRGRIFESCNFADLPRGHGRCFTSFRLCSLHQTFVFPTLRCAIALVFRPCEAHHSDTISSLQTGGTPVPLCSATFGDERAERT